MGLSRRRFMTNSMVAISCGASIGLVPTPAHAGPFAIFLGVMALSKTIVDMTGKPFKANPAAQQRQADPYMVALSENRRVMRSIHERLDGVNTALTAIMIEQQMLPQRIDRIVANQIQSLVPQIVSAELGRHRNETYATNLNAAINTFVEEVELGIPRARLDGRLDQIREYRNRVVASHGYSALTLCAAMDMELAAMKVLNYTRDQAIVVATIYRSEFVRKYNELRAIAQDARVQAERKRDDWPDDMLPTVKQYFVWKRSNGQTCDATPDIDWQRRDFPVSPDIGTFGYVEHTLSEIPVLSQSGPCESTNTCGGGCYTDANLLRQRQEDWANRVLQYSDSVNAFWGLRASVAEMMRTVDLTNDRLGVEISDWDA